MPSQLRAPLSGLTLALVSAVLAYHQPLRAELAGFEPFPSAAAGSDNPTTAVHGEPHSNTPSKSVTPQSVPVENLIGFYPFDDADNPLSDASGSGAELQSAGADPVYEAQGGFRGGAFSFDGSQHLVVPIDINVDVLPELTMGAWVKTSTLDPGLRKVIGHDNGGWDRTIGLDTRDTGNFRYTSFIGNGRPVVGTPGPTSTEEWTFLAAVYDQTAGEVTVYVDINASTIGDSLVAVTEPTEFGAGETTTSIGSITPTGAGEGWQGHIDNAFFFDAALTSEQLTELRDRGSPLEQEADDPDLVVLNEPDFGNLPAEPTVVEQSINLRNEGATQDLEIISVEVSGPDAAFYSVEAPETLGPAEEGTIAVTFDTLGQVGSFQAELALESNDPSEPQLTFDLSAQVAPKANEDPLLTMPGESPFGLLGAQPGSVSEQLEIANDGAAETLTLADVFIEGPDAQHYSIESSPESLAPGQTDLVSLTFDPMDTEGSFSATLVIISNDARNRRQTASLDAEILFSNSANALVGFYPFDSDASKYADASGNGNTLFEPNNAEPPQFTEGIDTGALDFVLGANRVVAPININPGVRPKLTMGAWVQTFSLESGSRKFIAHDDGGWDRAIGLDTRQTEVLRYTSFVGGPPLEGTPEVGNEVFENWHFVAAVYDETKDQVDFYVDLDATTTDDDLVAVSGTTSFGPGATTTSIGSLNPNNQNEGWDGLVDNLFFFETALPGEVLTQIRNQGAQAILDGVELATEPLLITDVSRITQDITPDELPLTLQVEVSNFAETEDLNISNAVITGADSGVFSVESFPSTLAPGEAGSIEISMDPGEERGGFTAELELSSNDVQSPTQRVALSIFVDFGSPELALLGFYPFDNSGNPLEDAGPQGNDLQTVQDAVPLHAPDAGFEGGAYEFDGATRLIAPININPSVFPRLTMGAWVKTSNLDAGQRKVMGHDDGGWDRTIGLDSRQGEFRYSSFNGMGIVGGSPGPDNTEDWTFFAAVYNEDTSEVSVYVDLDAATTDDPLVAVTEPSNFNPGQETLSIGSLRPDNANEGWVGFIDNAFVYQTALSSSVLTGLRNGGADAVLNGPPPVDTDSDGDGLTDAEEEIAGTDPNDPDSTFVVTATEAAEGIELAWPSADGRSYRVDYKATLADDWQEITTLSSQGATTTFTETDPDRLGNPTGFYRVVVSLNQ